MLVAAAVRRYPYSPFRVRPHNFPPWNSAVHKSVDARSASQAATKSVRPLQRTKLSKPPAHKVPYRRDSISFNYTPEIENLGTARGIRIVHNPEQQKRRSGFPPRPACLQPAHSVQVIETT